MKKNQKPGYLVIGSIIIGIVSILMIYLVLIASGVIQTSKNHIVITTASAEKMYDGTVLTANGEEDWQIAHGELLAGHVIEATVLGEQTVVGESDNIISLTIYDSQGADVTSKYHIEYQLGKLAVKGKRLAFSVRSADKYYDGEPLVIADGDWDLVEGELIEGHRFTAHAIGEITNIGTAPSKLMVTVYDSADNDVTSHYSIEIAEGELKVQPRRIVVASSITGNLSASGGTLDSDTVFVSGSLLEGHTAYYKPLDAGVGDTSISTIFVYVLDSAGKDVTTYYEIVTAFGDLTIENPETFFPEVPSDILNTDGYKDLLEDMGGSLSGMMGGLDIDGDKIPDLPIDSDGGVDIDGDGEADMFIKDDGTVDIDGDGVGDVPIDAEGGFDTDGDGVSDSFIIDEGMLDTDGDGLGDLPINPDGMIDIDGDGEGDIPAALGALALLECYIVTSDSDGYIYLREKSYGDFDGNDWTSPTVYTGEIHPYLFSTASLQNAGYSEMMIYVTPKLSGLTYSLPYYYTSGDYIAAFMNDCYANDLSQVDVTYLANYIAFSYISGGMPQVPDHLVSQESEYRKFVYENYLGVSEETRKELERLAAENGLSAENGDLIELVAEYIRNAATYNLEFAAFPDDKDNVIYFLTEGKEGVCRHFAAAATLMYRTLGIPARYTVGFATEVLAGQSVSVKALQAHAWVEVYIDGFGWVQIEVTPGGSGGGGPTGGGPVEGEPGEGEPGEGEPGEGKPGGGKPGEDQEAGGLNGNNAMGSVPADVKENANKEVAEIHTTKTGDTYLRVKSFGPFDGVNWCDAIEADTDVLTISPFTINLLGLTGTGSGKLYQLKITALMDNCPYMLPYYAQITDNISTDCQVFGEYIVGETVAVRYTYYDYLKSGLVYLPAELSDAEELYVKTYIEQYLDIDSYTKEFLMGKFSAAGVSVDDSVDVDTI